MAEHSQPPAAETLFLSTIPGATPSKWVERFTSRDRTVQLLNHDDAAQTLFLTPPAPGEPARGIPQLGYLRWPAEMQPAQMLEQSGIDSDIVHVVRLYEEEPVVCVGADHLLAAWDLELDGPVPAGELDPAGLIDPAQFAPPPPEDALDPPERVGSGERMALEIVASGAGHTVLPASVARMFGRKDLVVLPLVDHSGWNVGLAWLKALDSDLVQDFVGVTRGRRPASSRNAAPQGKQGVKHSTKKPAKKGAPHGKQGKTTKKPSTRGRR